MKSNFEQYVAHNRKITHLSNISSIIYLDGILNLPDEAGDIRAEGEGLLGEMIHSLVTDKQYVKLCMQLQENERDDLRRKNIAISVKDILQEQKLPKKFVKEHTELQSNSQNTYYKARDKKDFSIFAPMLEKMVASMRKKAEYLGVKGTYYNTLLNEFDEGLTEDILNPVFNTIKRELLPMIKKLYAIKKEVKPLIIDTSDEKKNLGLFEDILTEIGYNLKRGKVITCPASFMIDGNPMDARMMIRNSGKILDMLGSVIHEGGHGIYEQSFDPAYLGLPMSKGTSYTIHESQSRLYELNMGNSREYLGRIFDYLKKHFPESMTEITPEDLYFLANKVVPTKRRVEGDEISYHIHIMIRYEVERDLVNGKIQVKDVKQLWNAKYREYLGIEFDNEGEGVLQDIHWSDGSFGYFPTYSLGTFCSAQFFAQMEKEIPDFRQKIARGKLEEMKAWLNEKVHSHGRLKTSQEILKFATGKELDINIFRLNCK